MIDPISNVVSEYGGSRSLRPATPAEIPEIKFDDVMADMVSNSVETLKAADSTAVRGIMGQADTREVVDAVMQAEQALQASIAIRDKIVTAYLETTRMSI